MDSADSSVLRVICHGGHAQDRNGYSGHRDQAGRDQVTVTRPTITRASSNDQNHHEARRLMRAWVIWVNEDRSDVVTSCSMRTDQTRT